MLDIALNILNKIKNLGYEAYIIGGYPRNKYMGINSGDIDICTNIEMDLLKSNFNVINDNSYGSFKVLEQGVEFEITLYRKEIYIDSRYPKVEFISELSDDLQRRDFIINTLCIDYSGNYVDILGAIEDIENKIIRVVGDIDKKITEDPLRIIRAIRFASDLNFIVDEELFKFIKNNGFLIEKITNNRLQKEIAKVKEKEKFYNLLNILALSQYIK